VRYEYNVSIPGEQSLGIVLITKACGGGNLPNRAERITNAFSFFLIAIFSLLTLYGVRRYILITIIGK
jgi:hypothetical protein